MRFNLPIALGDPLYFESDTFFCHEAEYGRIARGCKSENGVPYSLGLKPNQRLEAEQLSRFTDGVDTEGGA
jgi:hypothetical protein